MKQIDRMDLSMMPLAKFKEHINGELSFLAKEAEGVDGMLSALISSLLRNTVLGDGDVDVFRDMIISDIEKWDKKLEERTNKLHGWLKDYTYALVTEGELNDVDVKTIEKMADSLDEFLTRYDDRDFSTYGVEGIKDLITRIEFFGKQIIEFRFWDSTYNINLFAESLILTGKHIRDKGNHVKHVKMGRKCMAAGGMLKKAYSHDMDHALSNYYEGSYSTFDKLNDGSRLYSWNMEYKTSHPKRLEKMMKIASKRNQVNEIQRQIDAWSNITKQVGKYVVPYPVINQWWD